MKKNEGIWATNVTELMDIFRDSLLALIPSMERAKISWKDQEAYDDWEDIERTLFYNIVIRSIKYSKQLEGLSEPLIPKYGFCYDDYLENSFIATIASNYMEGCEFLVFKCLTTLKNPFDSISFLGIDQEGKVVNAGYIPYEATQFQFNYRQPDKTLSNINDLIVNL